MQTVIKDFIKTMVGKRMNMSLNEVNMLLTRKAFVTTKTDKDKLIKLMHQLWPVSSEGKELIRLGPPGDGGYLIPDDLAGIKACFSPGVDLISGFEKDCAELGMKVFLADKSVNKPAESHPSFNFTQKYLGIKNNKDFITLDHWVTSCLSDTESDLLLQIDIEGAEYELFLNVSDSVMKRFRIIVGEFHNLDQLWNKPFFRLVSRTFDKILQTHSCVHIHPNNCSSPIKKDNLEIPKFTEFTFLRKDRLNNPSFSRVFPHPLDVDNTNKPSVVLPQCWYFHE